MSAGWAEQDELERFALLESLYGGEGLDDFIRRISPTLPPPTHVAPLRKLIERTRHEEVRALVSLPRRHAKTVTLLHGLAWRIQRDPACLNAFCGYNDDFARDKSREVRHLAMMAGIALDDSAASVNNWRTGYGGGLLATSIMGPLVGHGITGLLVVDDPIKNPQEAASTLIRNRVYDWFMQVASPTMQPGASAIVCATRWHQDDLIGRLQKPGLGHKWEVLELPAVSDATGKAVDERLCDDARAIWPEEWPLERLAKYRKDMLEHSWWAMYQQQPRPSGEVLFHDPPRFDLGAFTSEGCRIVHAVDPAATEKTHADYSVCVTAALKGRGSESKIYILDVQRWQVQIPELVRRLLMLQDHSRWGRGAPMLVEAVGGFKAVPQMLRSAAPGLRVTDIQPQGDKMTRAQPTAVAWNQGLIHVPEQAPWVGEYLAEMQAFTGIGDAHDDQVDATVHAVDYLRGDMSAAAKMRALASL